MAENEIDYIELTRALARAFRQMHPGREFRITEDVRKNNYAVILSRVRESGNATDGAYEIKSNMLGGYFPLFLGKSLISKTDAYLNLIEDFLYNATGNELDAHTVEELKMKLELRGLL